MRPLLVAALVLGAVACGGGGGDGALAITCHVAHRSDAETGQPVEAPPVELVAGEPREVEGSGGLVWRGLYTDDEQEGRVLTTQVVDGADRLVSSTLFQIEGRPRNDFRGGHGFTGLAYAGSPEGAEVQWWCTAG